MRTVTGALVLLAALVAPSVAAAAYPQCLLTCSVVTDCCAVEDCLRAPCGAYGSCVDTATAEFNTCIEAIPNNPRCRSTGGGRCTITLGCVRKCKSVRRIAIRACRQQTFRNLSTDCPACQDPLNTSQQKTVANACGNCTDTIPPTTTTSSTTTSTSSSTVADATTTSTTSVTTTTGTTRSPTTTVPGATCAKPGLGSCQRACLLRISSLKKNYRRCETACDGDGCADNICKQNARNIACKAIRARCTLDGDNVDLGFVTCCANSPNQECPTLDEVDEELCRILPTTTSTTSTTSTSVASTTSTTTTTLGTVGAIFGWGN